MDERSAEERVEAGEPVTRAEAEAHVRAVKRTCSGGAVMSLELQRAIFDRLDAGDDPSQLVSELIAAAEAADVERAGKPKIAAYMRALAGRMETMRDAVIAAARTKRADVGEGCGRDFNDEVCAQPFDGEEREAKCPKCGTVARYRSPVIKVSD
jgi:hypothetical protein